MTIASADNIERRHTTRHRARTMVRVKTTLGKTKLCKAINLSAGGCAIETMGMGLSKNENVDLMFVINLGTISKLHHRKARVVHVKNGITGLAMARYEPRT